MTPFKIEIRRFKKTLKPNKTPFETFNGMIQFFNFYFEYIQKEKKDMDAKIKKLEKNTKNLVKAEKSILKEDKKRDKLVEKGKMAKKKGC